MICKPSVFFRAIVYSLSLLLFLAVSQSASAQVVFENDFNQYTAERLYTETDLEVDWGVTGFNDGVTEGRVSVVGPSQAFGGTGSALAVFYPANRFGTKETGAQWKLKFGAQYEEMFLSYRVKFGSGFDFVRGGKLPGLAGGSAPTGNRRADGANGWTGRFMWRTDFKGVSGNPEQRVSEAISYAQYTDSGLRSDGTSEDREYWVDAAGDRVKIQSGQWYQIKQRVKMNEPGQSDGIMQIWLDGEVVLDQRDILFRTTDKLKIDQVYFSTFFGGKEGWVTSKNGTVYFDDFLIYQKNIPAEIADPRPSQHQTLSTGGND